MTNARERLIKAAQELFWEQGVSSTAPRAVLARSGVGQGSLYHHFPTKAALAGAALSATVEQTLERARGDLADGSALAGIKSYLTKRRDGLAGCRVGRHASEQTVIDDPQLRLPLARYFEDMHRLMEERLREIPGDGVATIPPEILADTILATVQGGYVLARSTGDQVHMDRAVHGLAALLELAERASDAGV